MQLSQRTLLAAVLLLATATTAFSQGESAFLSGDYGFMGGYGYGGYEAPTYDTTPTYYYAETPQYGEYSYGYPSPTYSYGYRVPHQDAATFPAPYYGSPTPTYYYQAGAPTYYYTAQVDTAPPGYYFTTPATYSYSTYPTYSYPAPTFYYSSVTPSTCPPCPSCSTAFVGHAATSHLAIAPAAAAPGTCYCPYDADWKTWAVSDPACRTALYSKCKSDSRLPCDWLDQYYSVTTSPASAFTRPHEQQIYAYLYSDCAPAPPCACAPLTFTSSDSPSQVYTCCRQLATYSQIPFSGLSQTVADAFCSSGKRAADVKAWVTHALWHASCPASTTSSSAVYTHGSTNVAKSSGTASASAIQPETSTVQSAADRRAKHRRAAIATAAAATGGAVGGALLAAAVALVVLHLRRPRHEGVYHAVV